MMYRWTYVDDRGKWYLRSKSYFSFGLTLHAVLQRFHDVGDKGVVTTEQAIAAVEENWIQAGYASQDEMMQAMSEGKAVIENYVEAVATQPVTSKTLYVEKQLRGDLGEFDLVGRLDRIEEGDDGTIEVIDYKSGRQDVSPEEIATDIAMGCYQLLLTQNFPGRKVCATIIALQSGARATTSFSSEELEQFKFDVVYLGREILHRDYEGITPVGKTLCHGCDFLPLCSKHPDFYLPD